MCFICFLLITGISFYPCLSISSKHIELTTGFQKFRISCDSKQSVKTPRKGMEMIMMRTWRTLSLAACLGLRIHQMHTVTIIIFRVETGTRELKYLSKFSDIVQNGPGYSIQEPAIDFICIPRPS